MNSIERVLKHKIIMIVSLGTIFIPHKSFFFFFFCLNTKHFWIHFIFIGDQSGQIHFEGYQVSNVCMALVNDDCLIPTKDAPELGYIKESSNEQYVPDVFYKVNCFMR